MKRLSLNLPADQEDLEGINMNKQAVKLVLATNNKNKVIEINDLVKDLNIEVLGIKDLIKDFDVEENGKTFMENARIKAAAAAKASECIAFGDDSGLAVDALNGAPGIYSSRYEATDEKRINRVLNELKNVPPEKRTARFVCAIALAAPDGKILFECEGKCEGIIAEKPKGNKGFGYDPIFYINEKNATMAELSLEDKNTVSHRSKAMKMLIDRLKSNINELK